MLVLPAMLSTTESPVVVSAFNLTAGIDIAVDHVQSITRKKATQNQNKALEDRWWKDQQLFQGLSGFAVHLPPPHHALRLLSIGERSISTLQSNFALTVPPDGGGVRGIISLLVLERLMPPGKRPCDVFDLIGGTSTGG